MRCWTNSSTNCRWPLSLHKESLREPQQTFLCFFCFCIFSFSGTYKDKINSSVPQAFAPEAGTHIKRVRACLLALWGTATGPTEQAPPHPKSVFPAKQPAPCNGKLKCKRRLLFQCSHINAAIYIPFSFISWMDRMLESNYRFSFFFFLLFSSPWAPSQLDIAHTRNPYSPYSCDDRGHRSD